MDGVRVISSVAVFLFVLRASFSAAREERATQWTTVAALTDIKVLALLEYPKSGSGFGYCSGSITSEKTVLTYCTEDPEKAYAGLLKLADKAEAKQTREVVNVVPHSAQLSALKICILNKKLELTDEVAVVGIPPSALSADVTDCTLLGFGGDNTIAQKLPGQKIGPLLCGGTHEGDELYSVLLAANKANLAFKDADLGGPAFCGDVQQGINKKYIAGDTEADGCNVFVNVGKYSPWIEEQKTAAEAAGAAGGNGGTGGTGGTGGNGTASSGYSIHSHLNKYSNWKVLWFLVPPIVAFLQY